MTPDLIRRLKELASKATQGPWEFVETTSKWEKYSSGPPFVSFEVQGPERFDSNGNDSNFCHRTDHRGDAEFIALANPANITDLCSIVEMLTGALKWYGSAEAWESTDCSFDSTPLCLDKGARARTALSEARKLRQG